MTFYYKTSVRKSPEKDKVWTDKHEEFCLENRITPAARLLWQYLIKQGELNNESEPDLAEFNAEIAKHRGKGYCRVTLKKALSQLIDLRIIHLVKRFTWRLVRIVTRSISDLFPKKKLRNENESYALPTPNPQSSEPGIGSSSNSSLIQANVQALTDAGMYFDELCTEVVDRPANEIKLALFLFEWRGGFEKIPNPEGWIRNCLRNRLWEEPRNYEYILSKVGNLTTSVELFPDEVITPTTIFGLDINSLKNHFPQT